MSVFRSPYWLTCRIIARPAASLSAAADLAEQAGYQVEILSDMLVGEARDVGALHAVRAIDAADRGGKLCILSGVRLP